METKRSDLLQRALQHVLKTREELNIINVETTRLLSWERLSGDVIVLPFDDHDLNPRMRTETSARLPIGIGLYREVPSDKGAGKVTIMYAVITVNSLEYVTNDLVNKCIYCPSSCFSIVWRNPTWAHTLPLSTPSTLVAPVVQTEVLPHNGDDGDDDDDGRPSSATWVDPLFIADRALRDPTAEKSNVDEWLLDYYDVMCDVAFCLALLRGPRPPKLGELIATVAPYWRGRRVLTEQKARDTAYCIFIQFIVGGHYTRAEQNEFVDMERLLAAMLGILTTTTSTLSDAAVVEVTRLEWHQSRSASLQQILAVEVADKVDARVSKSASDIGRDVSYQEALPVAGRPSDARITMFRYLTSVLHHRHAHATEGRIVQALHAYRAGTLSDEACWNLLSDRKLLVLLRSSPARFAPYRDATERLELAFAVTHGAWGGKTAERKRRDLSALLLRTLSPKNERGPIDLGMTFNVRGAIGGDLKLLRNVLPACMRRVVDHGRTASHFGNDDRWRVAHFLAELGFGESDVTQLVSFFLPPPDPSTNRGALHHKSTRTLREAFTAVLRPGASIRAVGCHSIIHASESDGTKSCALVCPWASRKECAADLQIEDLVRSPQHAVALRVRALMKRPSDSTPAATLTSSSSSEKV